MNAEHFDNFIKFTKEALKDLDYGEQKDFICPICGANAHAERIPDGGVLSAKCDSCTMAVVK